MKVSNIPHLVRAIIEKRLSASSRSLREEVNHVARHLSSNGSIHAFQPKRFLATAPSNRPPKPKPTTVRRLPTASPFAAPVPRTEQHVVSNKGTYNPSADPKRVSRMLMASCAFGSIIGIYVVYTYLSWKKDLQRYEANPNKLDLYGDVSDRWEDETRNFDREVEDSEKFMLLRPKRRRLVNEAYGDVLEVSVGTGRNMELYDTRPYNAIEDSTYGRSRRHMITSLTFNDQSAVMIHEAQKKWDIQQKQKPENARFKGKVNWVIGDAGLPEVLKRPDGGYDTIIQSMGICSMADPVQFLRHLGYLARQPGEPLKNASTARMQAEEGDDGRGGRIFLLEHGRSRYDWLNRLLDRSAPIHADRYGCWYNKDIGKVIDESGLIVERVKRYHFGTTWEIVLRPSPVQQPNLRESGLEDVKITSAGERTDKERSSWTSKLWG